MIKQEMIKKPWHTFDPHDVVWETWKSSLRNESREAFLMLKNIDSLTYYELCELKKYKSFLSISQIEDIDRRIDNTCNSLLNILTYDELCKIKTKRSSILTSYQNKYLDQIIDNKYKSLIDQRVEKHLKDVKIKKTILELKQDHFKSLLYTLKNKCLEKYKSQQEGLEHYNSIVKCFKGNKNNIKILTSEIKSIERQIKILQS